MRANRRYGLGAMLLLVGEASPLDAKPPPGVDVELQSDLVVEAPGYFFIGKLADLSVFAKGVKTPLPQRMASWVFSDIGRVVEGRISRELEVVGVRGPVDCAIEPADMPASLFETGKYSTWQMQGHPPFDPPQKTHECRFQWRARVPGGGLVAGEGVVAVLRRPELHTYGYYVGDGLQLQVKSVQVTHKDERVPGLRFGPVTARVEKPWAAVLGRVRRAVTRIASRLERR